MSEEKSVFGLPPNAAAALSFVAGFVTGVIVFVLEKDNRFVKFHAMQSILLSVAFLILSIAVGFLPLFHKALYGMVQIAYLICWILAIVKAAQGQYFKFPLIGDWAEKQI